MSEQADSNAALASPPGTVTIGATTYLVDKLTTASAFAIYDRAMSEAQRLYNPFRELCDSLKGLDVSPADKSMLLAQAQQPHKEVTSGDVPASVVTKWLRSREGVAFY